MEKFVILTKEDLDQFKEELLSEIKKIVDPLSKRTQYLRSADVRKMLNISDSTLQTMRINGIIPAYRLDSTWFYKYEEIIDAIENGKTKWVFTLERKFGER